MAGRLPALRTPVLALQPQVAVQPEPFPVFQKRREFEIHLYDSGTEPYYKVAEINKVLTLEQFAQFAKAFSISDLTGTVYPLDYIRFIARLDEKQS